MRFVPVLALAALLAPPAVAETVSTGPNGFHIRHKVNLVIPTDKAYALLGQPSLWWSGDHSYSGDAANFRIELRPGGCFCERLPDNGGFVEHMRIVQVQPGQSVVMTGGLGPLVFEGASGTMVWSVESSGTGSVLTLDYKTYGFTDGNGAALAGAVDGVLGEQVQRLRRRAAAGNRRDIP